MQKNLALIPQRQIDETQEGLLPMLGEGVLTELLRMVYEIFFSNAPKSPILPEIS